MAGCQQTSLDYPRLLAAELELELTDVTCSGAVTDDFFAPQDVTPPPPPPAQLDVFDTVQPDVVTVTIGGNDLGFTDIATTCLAASADGPLFSQLAVGQQVSSCQEFFSSEAGAAQDPYARIPEVAAEVRAALVAVQDAAPGAEVAVVGYPAITPDVANTPEGGCFNANLLPAPVLVQGVPLASTLPFTDVDIPYLQVLQEQLNDAIAEQAADLNITYADVYPASLSRSACSAAGVRWVEPLVPGNGGTNVLHPSQLGTQAMADVLRPVVAELVAGTPGPAPTSPAPNSPAPSTVPTPSTAAPAPAPTAAAPAPAPAGPAPAPTSSTTVAPAPQASGPIASVPLANTGPGDVLPVFWGGAGAVLLGSVLVGAGARTRAPTPKHRQR